MHCNYRTRWRCPAAGKNSDRRSLYKKRKATIFVCLSFARSIRLSTYLSLSPSIYLSIYLSISISVYLLIYLSIECIVNDRARRRCPAARENSDRRGLYKGREAPNIYRFVYLPIYLSIYLSISLYIPVHLCIYLSFDHSSLPVAPSNGQREWQRERPK